MANFRRCVSNGDDISTGTIFCGFAVVFDVDQHWEVVCREHLNFKEAFRRLRGEGREIPVV